METTDFTDALRDILAETDDEDLNQDIIRRIETFEEAGVLTRDAGLVVSMNDGSEFQITIVRSKAPTD